MNSCISTEWNHLCSHFAEFFYHSLYLDPDHRILLFHLCICWKTEHTKLRICTFSINIYSVWGIEALSFCLQISCLHDTFQEHGPTSQHPEYHEALSALFYSLHKFCTISTTAPYASYYFCPLGVFDSEWGRQKDYRPCHSIQNQLTLTINTAEQQLLLHHCLKPLLGVV